MKNVNEQIAELNAETKKQEKALKDQLKRLSSEHAKRIKALTKGHVLCKRDAIDIKYNAKTNKISCLLTPFGCKGLYIPKEDFYFIEVEDYDIRTTGWDAGYGDCDTFAIFHVVKKYRVCPKCGRCEFIDEKILEQSHSWARCNCHCDYPKGFIPEDWKEQIRRI